jgi:hypothetical protein
MKSPTPITLLAGLGLSATLMAAGCAGNGQLDAVTVLRHDQCEGLEPGLTRVDMAALARIRGSTLLGMAAPEPDAADDLLLIAVSRGSQRTAGFSLELERARREGATAVIEVRWQAPEPGAMVAQVITHPCLVVGLPADAIDRVEARDQYGEPLGNLDL